MTAFEALIGFPRFGKLYADAARNLDEAELDWSTTDPRADQTANVDRVEEILRKEASQWGQLVIEASSSDNGGKSPH